MIDHEAERNEFARSLAVVRRRVHRAAVLAALSSRSERTAATVLAYAIVAFAILMAVRPVGLRATIVACAGGVAVAVGCIAPTVLRAARRRPTLAEAAERLDLGLADHNRIATGYDLATDDERSPFARVAIAEGLDALRRCDANAAACDRPAWRAERLVASSLAAGAMLLLPAFLASRTSTVTSADGQAGRPLATIPRVAPDDGEADRPRTAPRAPQDRADAQSTSAASVATSAQARKATANGASALTPSASAGASAASADASTIAAPGGPSPVTPPGPRDRADAEATARADAKPTASESGSGGDTRGAADAGAAENGGRGSAGASVGADADRKPSPAHAAAGENGAAPDQADALADSEPRASDSGAGASPVRPDRGGAVSRELGQSGNSGESGNGRGGPSEGKKARGAGAVLFSAPVPDYVPGRLSPGASRTTRQEVPPQAMTIPAPDAAAVAERGRGDESIIDRYDVSLERAADVAGYFRALRRADDEAAAAPPPADQGAATP